MPARGNRGTQASELGRVEDQSWKDQWHSLSSEDAGLTEHGEHETWSEAVHPGFRSEVGVLGTWDQTRKRGQRS